MDRLVQYAPMAFNLKLSLIFHDLAKVSYASITATAEELTFECSFQRRNLQTYWLKFIMFVEEPHPQTSQTLMEYHLYYDLTQEC